MRGCHWLYMDDPYNLHRFIEAQAPVYETALSEIRAGRKRSHWMWFLFPQLAALGHSPTAKFFGIASIKEARAYLAHPLLGSRLLECVFALQQSAETSAEQIFGSVDAMKLRSCLTLFRQAGGEPVFEEALSRWFAAPDDRTLALLNP